MQIYEITISKKSNRQENLELILSAIIPANIAETGLK